MRFYTYIFTFGCLFSLQAAALPQLDSSKWAMQIFWLIIIFGALFFALQKFALPQVSETISTRENRITERLEDARHLFEEAKESQTSQNDFLISARNKAQDIRQETQKKVNEQSRTELKKLNEDIELKFTQTEQEIHSQIQQAQQNINNVASVVIKDIFEQITGKDISEEQALKTLSQIEGNT